MIALVGKTCSGKDSTRIALDIMGYKPIVSYTTRPKRDGEVHGYSYKFISKFKFKFLKAFDFFAESQSYKVASGETWYYGTSKRDIRNNKDGVIILTPKSLHELKINSDLEFTSFFLEVSNKELKRRLLERGDDVDEADRRMLADAMDFLGVYHDIDHVIMCDGKSVKQIVDEIIEIKNK